MKAGIFDRRIAVLHFVWSMIATIGTPIVTVAATCNPPTSAIVETDPPDAHASLDARCGDPSFVVKVRLVGGDNCYSISGITWTVEGGTGAIIEPDTSLNPPTRATVRAFQSSAMPGTAIVKAVVAFQMSDPLCSGSNGTRTGTLNAEVLSNNGGGGAGAGGGGGDGGSTGTANNGPAGTGVGGSCCGGGSSSATGGASGGPQAGSGSVGGNGVHATFQLGRYDQDLGAGVLSIDANSPSSALGTPATLIYNYLRTNVFRYPATGTLQQVKSPDVLARVIDTSSTDDLYKIEFFYAADVTFNSTIWVPNGGAQPFVTWTVRLVPGYGGNVVEISSTQGETHTFTYDTGTSKWSLTSGGVRTIVTWETTAGSQTDRYVEVKDGSTVVARTWKRYQTIGGQKYLAKVEHGTGSTLLTTTYTLIASGNGAGKPQRIDYPDGRWEMFTYDARGRMLVHYEAYADYSAPTPPNFPADKTSRRTTSDYTAWTTGSGVTDDGSRFIDTPRSVLVEIPFVDPVSQITTWAAVSQKFFWSPAADTSVEAVSPTPGSGNPSASSNLITTTTYFIDPANSYRYERVQSIVRPDGTGTVYDYTGDSNGTTTTEANGQLTVGLPPVYNGTELEIKADPLGKLTSLKSRLIENGAAPSIVLSLQTYAYATTGLKRDYTVTDLAGRQTQFFFNACCGQLSSIIDLDGRTTSFEYDVLKRRISTSTIWGSSGVKMTNALDAAGRVLVTYRIPTTGGAFQTLDQNQYDVLGRVTRQTNALGGITAFDYSVVRRITTTFPDGGTRIDDSFLDGSPKKVAGTAAAGSRYEKSASIEGSLKRESLKQMALDANGNDTQEWTITVMDDLYNTLKTYHAKVSTPYPYAENVYNSLGQHIRQRDPDGVTQMFAYDSQGRRYRSALDKNANNGIDDSSDDRITETVWTILPTATSGRGCDIVKTEVYRFSASGSTTKVLASRMEVSTDGLKSWSSLFRASGGSAAVTSTQMGLAVSGVKTETTTFPDGSKLVRTLTYGRVTAEQRTTSASVQVSLQNYAYESYGRVTTMTDARSGTITYAYNNADQQLSQTTPAPGNGDAPQFTQQFYDTQGRLKGRILPDNTSVTNFYLLTGLLEKTWGSRAYPVAYTYDAQGRMKTMKTWQTFSGGSGTAAITTWNYDAYRGWLQSKRYADPSTGAAGTQGPSYAYTDAGRLLTRTWQRGVVAAYGYTTGDLTSITYSNDPVGTAPVTYSYDRRGRRTGVVRNSITTTVAYTEADQLLSESYSGGTLGGLSVGRAYYDTLQLSHVTATGASGTLVDGYYQYDGAGRLDTVMDYQQSSIWVKYAYETDASLVKSLAFTNNSTAGMVTRRTYDRLNRLLEISSQPYLSGAANGLPISFGYLYNTANQRTRMDLADGSYWVYQYDTLGQVTSGRRYWADDSEVAGQQFTYQFDDIGNRKTTGGRDSAVSTYSNNQINQITSHTVAGTVDVMGLANPTAGVTVQLDAGSQQTANRKGEYFHLPLAVGNTSAPQYPQVTVRSQYGATQTVGPGRVFVAQTPESLTYDTDGNLTSDGRWSTYVWDAENRLIEMRRDTATPAEAKEKLTFEYDHQCRRIRKTFFTWISGAWAEQRDTIYLYDGWNLIAELDANASNVRLRTYTWGTDLSGTISGAGGVGGLLWVNNYQGSTTGHQFVSYDGSGNVAGLLKASDNTVTAIYQYGPFGEALRTSGPLSKSNAVRFSTKLIDDESGLLYYGYRFLSTQSGRWLSRDPVSEAGGLNLSVFVNNSPLLYFDYLGMEPGVPPGWMSGGVYNPRMNPFHREPPSRPYPPPTPFPQRLLSKYDSGCCDDESIDRGLRTLKERFNTAKTYVDKKGLIADASANVPGRASCYRSNNAILSFMERTPPCWICFMDRRKDSPFGWDENFITCYTINKRNVKKEVVFDWFDSSEYKESGIYDPPDRFFLRHPLLVNQPKSVPREADCQRNYTWTPDYYGLDSLFSKNGDY